MSKKKSIFRVLSGKPDSAKVKHKKKYLEDEYDEYEEYYEDDDTYEDEEYYEDDNTYEDEEYYEEDDTYEDEEYYEEDDIDEYKEEYFEEDQYEDYAEYDNSEEYYEDEYYEEQYDDSEEYYEDEEVYVEPKKKRYSNDWPWYVKFYEWILTEVVNMDFMDYILVFTTVMLLIFAGMTISVVTASNEVEEAVESIAPIGTSLSQVGIIGENGLYAMTEAGTNGLLVGIEAATDTEEQAENTNTEETTQTEQVKAQISVSFESVEKDLKIKFKNTLTDSFITGTAFEVTITNKATGNSLTLVDDDMDGIIYKNGIKAGKFNAIITSTDKYRFPTTAQEITIKDKIEYVVINVEDEVKQEAEIEVAKEDTEVKVAKEETPETKPLTDTVEFVASTKTSSVASYTKIDKSKIADPGLKTSARALSMKFDDLSVSANPDKLSLLKETTKKIEINNTSNISEDSKKVTYTKNWSSSDEKIVTVDNDGNVKGIAEGTATVSCTVTEKTEIKERNYDYVQSINKETYEALDNKEGYEQKSVSDLTDEQKGMLSDALKEQQDLSVVYVPFEEKWNTSEKTGKASCEVTVEAVKVKSTTLELDTTSTSIATGSKITVKPAKVIYTKTDDSTETITTNFPSLVWASSDTAIATVDSKGEITAVKAGTTTIKACLFDDTSVFATVSITVVDGLSLSLEETKEPTLKIAETVQLHAVLKNSNQGVTWSTSDEKIATVSMGGMVTAVSTGTVTITCTSVEKSSLTSKPATITIKVNVASSAASDKTSKLKDTSGNQVYIKNSNGTYTEAVYADYYTATEFYIMDATSYTYTGWQTINGKTYFYNKNGKVVTGTQVIQGVSYEFGNDGALSTTVNGGTRGIDVSKWNGDIDWSAVKSSGIDYVIIRCGYRGSSTGALIEDVNFKKNIKGASEAGLKVGVYFFSQAIDEVEAVKEASFAISLVQGYKLAYPIFIDTEKSGGRGDALNASARTAVLNAFCQTVENAGYKAGIYASQTWFEKKINTNELTKYKIWIARYAGTIDYSGKYDMWQYTANGTVNGISSKVDYNYSYLGY